MSKIITLDISKWVDKGPACDDGLFVGLYCHIVSNVDLIFTFVCTDTHMSMYMSI